MKPIENLVYATSMSNEEANNYFKAILNVYELFLEEEDDRPVIESISASTKNNVRTLGNYVDIMKDKYSIFIATLDIPSKLLESDEIYLLNKLRIQIIEDIKRAIRIYKNVNAGETADILWNRLHILKNLRKLTMDKISGHIYNLLKDTSTIEMAPLCEEAKIKPLLNKLDEMQKRFDMLYTERAKKIEVRVLNSQPSKFECIKAYKDVIDFSNSMIIYNSDKDYQGLIDELNSIINPMNKRLRTRKKKNDDDRPIISSENEEIEENNQEE